jgi:S-DNA-T family DNA segregation ATPase FtsK/SpoIIIE
MLDPITLSIGLGLGITKLMATRNGPRRHLGPAKALPGASVLDTAPRPVGSDLAATGARLVATLAARGVKVALEGTVAGPTVARFDLSLGAGVRVARLTTLKEDIAYELGSKPRIINPVAPGVIGIEIERADRQMVTLASVIAGQPLGLLDIPLGLGVDGTPIRVNLGDLPHALVAGMTGAGKSTFLNALIVSLLMGASPRDLALVLIDPKRTELHQYEGLPHLWRPVVTDDDNALKVLGEVVAEMGKRYDYFHRHKVRDIKELRARGKGKHFPYLVVVIDELAELMLRAKVAVEPMLQSITQLGRAAGIHAVVATQRPDVTVITGKVKANLPSRIAFAVDSNTDSRVVLDSPGAELLLGKGDLLFKDGKGLMRAQSAYVSDNEIERVVEWWK